MASIPWTPEEDSVLTALWLDGEETRVMARHPVLQLNARKRNAIISRAHRLGLPPHKYRTGSGTVAAPRERRTRHAPVDIAVAKEAVVEQRAETAEEAIEPTLAQKMPNACSDVRGARQSIAALRSESCRWPIGDPLNPDFRFCGEEKIAGTSYCLDHYHAAYQAPSPRRTSLLESTIRRETRQKTLA